MISCGEDPIEPEVPEVPDTPSGPVEPEKPEETEEPITNIENSYEGKTVSYRGATITVRFDASVSRILEQNGISTLSHLANEDAPL